MSSELFNVGLWSGLVSPYGSDNKSFLHNIIYEESAADEIINLYPAIKFTSRTGVKTSPGL